MNTNSQFSYALLHRLTALLQSCSRYLESEVIFPRISLNFHFIEKKFQIKAVELHQVRLKMSCAYFFLFLRN